MRSILLAITLLFSIQVFSQGAILGRAATAFQIRVSNDTHQGKTVDDTWNDADILVIFDTKEPTFFITDESMCPGLPHLQETSLKQFRRDQYDRVGVGSCSVHNLPAIKHIITDGDMPLVWTNTDYRVIY